MCVYVCEYISECVFRCKCVCMGVYVVALYIYNNLNFFFNRLIDNSNRILKSHIYI